MKKNFTQPERRAKFSLKIIALVTIMMSQNILSHAKTKLDFVTVKTRAKENKEVKIWYRVPESYDAKANQEWRVLIYFNGRNGSGQSVARGPFGFDKWADRNGVFIVGPTFKNDEYWYPRKWSGRALMKGLERIKHKYNICDDKLLYFGYSCGAQCSNLFPAWNPMICRAWVSHASGVWHKPTSAMRNSPGVVTCGDADAKRYILSRKFVEESRKKGVPIIWKTFPNVPHSVPPGVVKLAQAFLEYQHKSHPEDLKSILRSRKTFDEKTRGKYVGDDQEGRFWPANSRIARFIPKADRVVLPNLTLAMAWGKPSDAVKAKQ